MKENISGIPKIHSVELNHSTVIIEEYIEGKSLYDIIRNNEALSVNDAKKIMLEVATIVSRLHSCDIIHRDIKPSNIIISDNGKVYLTDFDIARFYNPLTDKDTCLFGTVGYAPPEQFGYSSTDFKSDIYSFGMAMKDMFFYVKKQNCYKRILEKCIEFDPKNRYNTMKSVINHIKLKNFIFSKKFIAFIALTLSVLIYFFTSFLFTANEEPYSKEPTDFDKTAESSSDIETESSPYAPTPDSDFQVVEPKSNTTAEKNSKNHSSNTIVVSPDIDKETPDKELYTPSVENETTPQPEISVAEANLCFYCQNPAITLFGERRYCSDHAPKCTTCGKIIKSGQSNICQDCVFAKIDSY